MMRKTHKDHGKRRSLPGWDTLTRFYQGLRIEFLFSDPARSLVIHEDFYKNLGDLKLPDVSIS